MLRRTQSGWIRSGIEERTGRYLESLKWRPQTLDQAVAARLAEDEHRLAVIDGPIRLTRRDLYENALRLGHALRRRGLTKGAVVSMQLPNWNEACVVNLACALFGFVINPLLPMYRERDLSFMLSQCRSDALFIPEAFRNCHYPSLIAATSFENKDRVFTVRASSPHAASYEALILEGSEGTNIEQGDLSDIKIVLYTSGSTGRPKGVLHTHYSINALIHQASSFWGIDETDVLFVPSPVGHIGGSIYAFEFPWLTGTTALLMDTWDSTEAVRLIEREKATFCAGATPFLEGLLDSAKLEQTNLPSLRRFVCGGASVPAALLERALAYLTNTVVSSAYGSSEVPIICPGLRTREDALRHVRTDGEIHADVRIVDDGDDAVAVGEDGNILARAPRMFVGYLDTDDEAGQFAEHGYFRMGDVGRVVDSKFLKITGRKKEIIIRMGENLSPREVENVLLEHEALKEVAVVGVPDQRTGERAVLFATLKKGAAFDLVSMRSFLAKAGIAKQKFPEELHILSEMPINSIGKILKQDLKKLHGTLRRDLGTSQG